MLTNELPPAAAHLFTGLRLAVAYCTHAIQTPAASETTSPAAAQ